MTPADTATPTGARTVTLEDVRHVAELANLQLTPDEEPALERDLNNILGYIAQLAELDTTGVPAMSQVSEILPQGATSTGPAEQGSTDSATTLRPDAARPSLDRAPVMREAPETDGRFFKVPKVIER